MNIKHMAAGAGAAALGASSMGIAYRAVHGERPTALDVAGVIASAVSLAISVEAAKSTEATARRLQRIGS